MRGFTQRVNPWQRFVKDFMPAQDLFQLRIFVPTESVVTQLFLGTIRLSDEGNGLCPQQMFLFRRTSCALW
jgi:hypothetical protein